MVASTPFVAPEDDESRLRTGTTGPGGWATTSQVSFLAGLGAHIDVSFVTRDVLTYRQASAWIQEIRDKRYSANKRPALFTHPEDGWYAPPHTVGPETPADQVGKPTPPESQVSMSAPGEPAKEIAPVTNAPLERPEAHPRDAADSEMMDVLRNVVAPGASDAELRMLAMTGKALGLDVLRGQVKYVKIGGRGVIMVGIDGFRAIAEASGSYDGQDAPEYEYSDESLKHLVSATVKVYRKGMTHAVSATAFWDEYARDSPIWRQMPRLMLAKVAEALALRKAFPRGLAQLYAPEELDQARE